MLLPETVATEDTPANRDEKYRVDDGTCAEIDSKDTEQYNRSGEAGPSGEGGFRGLPRQRYNTTRAQQAKRSGERAFLRL